MNRTVVAIDLGNADQNNAVTVYAKTKDWHVWHWLENVWLLEGVSDELTPRVIWEEIRALPGMSNVKGIVFRTGTKPLYWGNNDQESWVWMREFWGEADFPKPPPPLDRSDV